MVMETKLLTDGTEPILDVALGLRAAYVDEVGTVKEFVTSNRTFRVPLSPMSPNQIQASIDRMMSKFPDGRLLLLRDEHGKMGVFCTVRI